MTDDRTKVPRGRSTLQRKNRRHLCGALKTMWKSFFLAAGIFACALGFELLFVDSAILLPLDGRSVARPFSAPDWAPWCLLSAGAVTILNFCTLPSKLVKE